MFYVAKYVGLIDLNFNTKNKIVENAKDVSLPRYCTEIAQKMVEKILN